MDLLHGTWPWWLGALVLSTLTVGFYILARRPLGFSSSLARVLDFKTERRMAKAQAAALRDPAAFDRALREATLAEFGQAAATGCDQDGAPPAAPAIAPRPPWSAQLTFVVMIAVGGFLGAALSGDFALRLDLGAEFARLVAGGGWLWPMLLLAGLLVGFGAQMAGGCTSGHGLSGCSRLQPGSLLATACFFGTAVGVSFLLAWVAS
jgi:hypothetical protein